MYLTVSLPFFHGHTIVMSHGMKSVTNFSFLGFWLVGFVSFFQVITENLVVSLYMHGLVLNLTTF